MPRREAVSKRVRLLLLAGTVLLSAPAQWLDGLWMSEGYGDFFKIQGDSLHMFAVTSISCLPSLKASRLAGSQGDREIVFKGDDGATLRFSAGATADDRRMHVDGAASDVLLHRASTMPKLCQQPFENTPQSNYAIFWQTFAEQYAFFDLRKTDWRTIDAKFRPQVTSATKPDELFAIFRQMVEPLHDAHTGIVAHNIKQNFFGRRPDPNHLESAEWKQAAKIIESKYVQGGLRSFCHGRVQFGMLAGSIGYLRVTGFAGYANSRDYSEGLRALQSALDSSFGGPTQLRGLVIDVRLNTGGEDPLGFEIASRLANERYLAYSKITRDNLDPPLHYTAPQESWIEPSSRPGFRGNAVLLTGPDTVSAGETFTMALFGRNPHITRIGANTQGVFSDVLERELPNGWAFWLPNEVYLAKDGKSFDGAGVPPEIAVPFFSHGDLSNGRDAALDKALEILSASGGGKK
jgi:hypothetical protein